MEVGTLKFTWKIEDFSNVRAQIIISDVFSLGPYKWKITAYPKGLIVKDHLSIFLGVADAATLPSGWSQKAKFSLTVVNQSDNRFSRTREMKHEFNASADGYGTPSFISHKELYDITKGYLVEDTCIIKTELTIYGDAFVEEPKENSIEEMNSFFGSLQSLISNTVPTSEEVAKEALAIIEEALNKDPADVNNPGRLSRVRNAFDVLSLLEDCSVLTPEEKLELLSMKDKLIELPERATNAVNDIKLFTEKELVKKTLDHKLWRCLVEFEKTKVDSIQNDEKFDSLLAQIEETKKLRQRFSSRMEEMFKLSKELKVELDVLVENWPEYEAKLKAAEEEEKIVSTEWSKMKQLVSSMKKPIYPSSNTYFMN